MCGPRLSVSEVPLYATAGVLGLAPSQGQTHGIRQLLGVNIGRLIKSLHAVTSIQRFSAGQCGQLYFDPVYDTLYETAKRHPSQKDVPQIFAKLVVIGRVSGNGLERRPESMRVQDAGMVLQAAEAIAKSPLQTQLKRIEPSKGLLQIERKLVTTAHRTLESIFTECGSKSPGETAAMYLHCHRRNAFPLMGGQARIGAKLFLESVGRDSGFVSRVTRQGGYAAWVDVSALFIERMQSRWPGEFNLLQMNSHLEGFTLDEILSP